MDSSRRCFLASSGLDFFRRRRGLCFETPTLLRMTAVTRHGLGTDNCTKCGSLSVNLTVYGLADAFAIVVDIEDYMYSSLPSSSATWWQENKMRSVLFGHDVGGATDNMTKQVSPTSAHTSDGAHLSACLSESTTYRLTTAQADEPERNAERAEGRYKGSVP